MAGQDSAVEESRVLIKAQTRNLVERLSRTEEAQGNRGGRIGKSACEDQASYPGEQARSASGRRGGVTIDSLLQAVGEVGIAGGSTFALSPR